LNSNKQRRVENKSTLLVYKLSDFYDNIIENLINDEYKLISSTDFKYYMKFSNIIKINFKNNKITNYNLYSTTRKKYLFLFKILIKIFNNRERYKDIIYFLKSINHLFDFLHNRKFYCFYQYKLNISKIENKESVTDFIKIDLKVHNKRLIYSVIFKIFDYLTTYKIMTKDLKQLLPKKFENIENTDQKVEESDNLNIEDLKKIYIKEHLKK